MNLFSKKELLNINNLSASLCDVLMANGTANADQKMSNASTDCFDVGKGSCNFHISV